MSLGNLSSSLRSITVLLLTVLLGTAGAAHKREPANAANGVRCSKPSKSHRLVGWGKYGLQFYVPKDGVKLKLGKVDVDYVRHLVISRDRSYLQLWFGGNAGPSLDVKPELLAGSVDVRRDASNVRGTLRDGRLWRRFAGVAGGATYDNASPDAARLFDEIIDSYCYIEWPKN